MTQKIGIVGLGAIGNYLIDQAIAAPGFELIAVNDFLPEGYEKLKNRLKSPPPHLQVKDFPPDTDIFVESASASAVTEVVTEAMTRGKTVIVASIGGLVDNPEIWEVINSSHGQLILPSGAIGGLDILKALPTDEIEEVTLMTRKNPRSLSKEYASIAKATEIYSGSACEAVAKFPKNINVAAILSFAGIGPERTQVMIIADPSIQYNIHEISIKSKSGNYRITCENFPFEVNPATSRIAAQSIWAAVKSVNSHIMFGL